MQNDCLVWHKAAAANAGARFVAGTGDYDKELRRASACYIIIIIAGTKGFTLTNQNSVLVLTFILEIQEHCSAASALLSHHKLSS